MMVCVFSELKLPIPKNKEKHEETKCDGGSYKGECCCCSLTETCDALRLTPLTEAWTDWRDTAEDKKRSYHTFLIVFLYLKLWAVRENGCLVG